METCFEYLTNNDWGTFSTDEAKWVRRIKALQQDYPDQVEITAVNKDGSIVAHLPKSWFKVAPPRKRDMSEEQRTALAERMRSIRSNKT